MGLISDTRNAVAVFIRNKNVGILDHLGKTGYLKININGTTFYNCYISPNIPRAEFEAKVDEIMEDVRGLHNTNYIILGDFKSRLWCPNTMDERGIYIEQWMATLSMTALNNGQIPTFTRGTSETYIDIALASERAFRKTQDWKASLEESLSLYRFIIFEVNETEISQQRKRQLYRPKPQIDIENLRNSLDILRHNIGEVPGRLVKVLKGAQQASEIRHIESSRRNTPYWWNEDLSASRKNCNIQRRKRTRARRNRNQNAEEMQNLQRTYKAEKTAYKKEINASKKSKWRELCNELENDVWGQGYKIATRQIKNKNQLYELSNEEKRGIVDELFPD